MNRLALSAALLAVCFGRAAITATAEEGSDALNAVRRLMQERVIPASGVVFEAAVEPPTEENAWQDLARSAQILQNAAPELAEAPPDLAEHPWREDAATFQNTTRQLAAAITARDGEALSQLGDALYQSCETCHQVYLKPAQPVAD